MNDSTDKLAEVLRQVPFRDLETKIYSLDPHGSYTFNKMGPDSKWRVTPGLEYVLDGTGWTVEEFNKELHKRYDNK